MTNTSTKYLKYLKLCKTFEIKPVNVFSIRSIDSIEDSIQQHWSMLSDFVTQLEEILEE